MSEIARVHIGGTRKVYNNSSAFNREHNFQIRGIQFKWSTDHRRIITIRVRIIICLNDGRKIRDSLKTYLETKYEQYGAF